MSAINIEQLRAIVKDGRGRLLGLDVGSKTVGLALSDTRFIIASPLETIRRAGFKKDVAHLQHCIEEHKVLALIVGWPLNMDGSEGPRCQSVRQFVENILSVIDIPILWWDERLSTAAVTRTMLEADLSRRRRSQIVDKLAASYILQGVIDALAH